MEVEVVMPQLGSEMTKGTIVEWFKKEGDRVNKNEALFLVDTEKAVKLFSRYDVPMAGYIVNRVINRDLLKENIPEYLKNRIEMQSNALAMIDEKFGASVLSSVQEFDSEIKGLNTIKDLAEVMFEENLS